MNTALALIEPTQYELMSKLATVAARSGYTANNEVQALFVMLKGFEIGISPIQALEGIQVIKGKTTVSPQLMLAMINRSGLMEDISIDSTTDRCIVTMKRVGRSAHTETFTIQNAQSMGLAGNHNWKAQPATMLKWRAVSACARVVFPDVIQGMYTPEELGAEVSEDGSGDIVIEAPLLDANFKQAEDAVAQLVEKNPEPEVEYRQVDENGEVILPPQTGSKNAPQSNEKATSSDLGAETVTLDTTTTNSAETAKSRFAGNGAPPAGEQKRIGTEKPFVYDRIKLFMEAKKVKALADVNSTERNNTIIAMEAEGAFKDAADYQECVEKVIARVNSPEHGKSKKAVAS